METYSKTTSLRSYHWNSKSLSKEKKRTSKLKNTTKLNIDQLISKIHETATKILTQEKEKIFTILDQQVPRLISNYDTYQTKMQKFFQGVNQPAQFDSTKLLARINEQIETTNLEDLIREINSDIAENHVLLECTKNNSKSKLIQLQREHLQNFYEKFKIEISHIPAVSLADDSTCEALIEKFSDSLNALMKESSTMENIIQRCNLSLPLIPSAILQEKDKILLSS